MGKQYPTRERFLALPLERRLGIFREVLEFHTHAAKRGYVSVDFYDGCVLYEEDTGRTLLCDVDAYHKMPFANPVGRMWGSTRSWPRRSSKRGRPSMSGPWCTPWGALAFELFAPAGRAFSDWPLSQSAWECAKKAISPQREERYAD